MRKNYNMSKVINIGLLCKVINTYLSNRDILNNLAHKRHYHSYSLMKTSYVSTFKNIFKKTSSHGNSNRAFKL